MARHLFSKLTSTCTLTLLIMGCGGRTADVEEEDLLPSASGGWSNTALGGAFAYGGATFAKGGATMATGGNVWAAGGYYATGGYINYLGGKAATGGYRATGGYLTGTGGKASGGVSFAGGVSYAGKASGGVSGYTFAGGKAPTAGTAGVFRGGAAGAAGRISIPGGTAGRPPTGGAPTSAGAAGCPAIGCTTLCPLGNWTSLNGCGSCACVPPEKKLSYDTLSCPPESLTVSVAALQQTGTWVFNFSFTCSATAASLGQPLNASVGITILNNTADPLTSTNRTFSSDLVFSNPQLVVAGSGVPLITVPLSPASAAYFSIRREGNSFVGGLYLPATPTGGTASVMLAGSFNVAVP